LQRVEILQMTLIKRIALCLLVFALLLPLYGCSEVGGGSNNTSKVLSCDGGKKVTYDEYRYYYMNYRQSRPDADEKLLYSLVLADLARDRAITALAKEYDVKLDKEEKKALDDYIQSVIDEQGGEEKYQKYLSEDYLTGDLFRHIYSQKLLEQKLREYMSGEINGIIDSDDKTFEADLNKNFMAAKQVLICNDEGDNVKDNKALADEIYDRYLAGEDFDDLVSEYSEEDIVYQSEGRYFTVDMMLPEYEEAVLSLKEGEVYDGVLETDIGFHIIKRLPLDEEYVDSHYGELRDLYKTRCCNEIIDEWAKKITFDKVKSFSELDFE